MLFPNPLAPQYESPVAVTNSLLKLSGYYLKPELIEDTLMEHPGYPSLLSVFDTLSTVGVPTTTMKVYPEHLDALPLPFLAHLSEGKGRFVVVTGVNQDEVKFVEKKREKMGKKDFLEKWQGISLFVETQSIKGSIRGWLHPRSRGILLPLIFLCVLLKTGITISTGVANTAYYLGILGMSILGMAASVLLLKVQNGRTDGVAKKLCGLTNNKGCSDVLTSKYAKIFNVSWSELGALYFSGCSAVLILEPDYLSETLLFQAGSLLCLLYIPYSLYIQFRKVKGWCTLCLIIQFIFLVQFIVTWAMMDTAGYFYPKMSVAGIFLFVWLFLLPTAAWYTIKHIFDYDRRYKYIKHYFSRFRNNREIFTALLKQQPAIHENTENIGIHLGNPKARNKLIKVCNPFCGPCADSHPKIESLLTGNSDWSVQIIFVGTPSEHDFRTPPAKHFLAIQEHQHEMLAAALHEWYSADSFDYEGFVKKFPIEYDSKNQNEQVSLMRNWCDKQKIESTPTFFVNGHKLPEQYDISDLKYL